LSYRGSGGREGGVVSAQAAPPASDMHLFTC